jgi:hypothetical protein
MPRVKNWNKPAVAPTEEVQPPADVELGGGVMKEFEPDAVEQAVFVDPTPEPKPEEKPVAFSARTQAEMEVGRALLKKRNG